MLKIYVYGYLNRVQSSRRLEREAQRNVEMMWLTGRLVPDFKTMSDFRRDNGEAIRLVCREFVMLCDRLNLQANVASQIDGFQNFRCGLLGNPLSTVGVLGDTVISCYCKLLKVPTSVPLRY